MIEQVESVRLKLQGTTFRQLKLLVNTEVYIGEAGAGERITAQRPVAPPPSVTDDHPVVGTAGATRGAACRYNVINPSDHANELGRVKEAVRGALIVGVHTSKVRAKEDGPITCKPVCVGVLAAVIDSVGHARLNLNDAGHEPSAEPSVVLKEGHFISEAGDETVRDVKVGPTAVESDVSGILWPEVSVPRVGVEGVAKLVNRLREGVMGIELQPAPHTIPHADLAAVINRAERVSAEIICADRGIGSPRAAIIPGRDAAPAGLARPGKVLISTTPVSPRPAVAM